MILRFAGAACTGHIASVNIGAMNHVETRPEHRPYHHGDLKTALLAEAEKILERDGIPGLTLRAISRAAGVSHAAPNNHFGNLAGLLTELAAVGYRRYAALTKQKVDEAGPTLEGKRRSMARTFLAFSRQYPGLSTLMFRSDAIDRSLPSFREAFEELIQIYRDVGFAINTDEQLLADSVAHTVARNALLQGFAALYFAGRLDAILEELPGDTDVETLLELVLDQTKVGW